MNSAILNALEHIIHFQNKTWVLIHDVFFNFDNTNHHFFNNSHKLQNVHPFAFLLMNIVMTLHLLGSDLPFLQEGDPRFTSLSASSGF